MLIAAIRCQLVPLLLLVAGWGAWAQPTNLDLVRECSLSLTDSALSLVTVPILCYRAVPHPAVWLIEESVVKTAEQRGIQLQDCSNGMPAIKIAFTELNLLYRHGTEPETIARECRITVAVMVAPTGTEPQRQREFTAIRHDTVSISAVPLIEQPGYDYLRGVNIAPPNSNFWDRVMEPAIVLGAAAVSVILLFTVRSN